MRPLALAFCFVFSACVSLSAAVTEKGFNRDMAYYSRTSKSKNLGANDRLFILERFREKYKEADFDLSPLFSEIDRWYGVRMKNGKSAPVEPEPTEEPINEVRKIPAGNLTKALVTDTAGFSRLTLDVSGSPEFRQEMKKDAQGLNPPVVLIYFYNTRENLKPLSKNFAVKKGVIRQVQTQTISKKPLTVKVSVALREDRPYRVSKIRDQLILTVEKTPDEEPNAAIPETLIAAPMVISSTEAPRASLRVQISSPISVSIIGAVKSQGVLQVKEGTKLLEAIVLAGGFESNARLDRVRVIRTDQGKKVTQEYNLNEVFKKDPSRDILLKSGDLIIVPEKNVFKQTLLNGKFVPWATFFISMGLVLALLI